MSIYDYYCKNCDTVFEISHSIKSEEIWCCEKCGTEMQKKISCDFYVAGCSLKPSLADMKEDNYKKKVYDKDRAYKKRKKIFGSESGSPVDKPDPRHVFKKGRVLAGEQTEVSKKDLIKTMSKSDHCLDIAMKALKKNGA